MDHKWPTRKQLTMDDYNNTSVVKQKKTSAIGGIRRHQISRYGSFSVISDAEHTGCSFLYHGNDSPKLSIRAVTSNKQHHAQQLNHAGLS
jgi:hypothetical protein